MKSRLYAIIDRTREGKITAEELQAAPAPPGAGASHLADDPAQGKRVVSPDAEVGRTG